MLLFDPCMDPLVFWPYRTILTGNDWNRTRNAKTTVTVGHEINETQMRSLTKEAKLLSLPIILYFFFSKRRVKDFSDFFFVCIRVHPSPRTCAIELKS